MSTLHMRACGGPADPATTDIPSCIVRTVGYDVPIGGTMYLLEFDQWLPVSDPKLRPYRLHDCGCRALYMSIRDGKPFEREDHQLRNLWHVQWRGYTRAELLAFVNAISDAHYDTLEIET